MLALVLLPLLAAAEFDVYQPGTVDLELPLVGLSGVPLVIPLRFSAALSEDTLWPETVLVRVSGLRDGPAVFEVDPRSSETELEELVLDGTGQKRLEFDFAEDASFSSPLLSETRRLRVIPGWVSILPSLLTVGVALYTRQVLPSLFFGLFVGGTLIWGYNPGTGFLRALDTIVVDTLADREHAAIIFFSLLLGGMMGVMAKGGGSQGMSKAVGSVANTPQRAQLAAWLLGLLIFFDDYSNALITGSSMRMICDELRVSRARLAFIVHSMAATVSSIAPVSSWTAVELSYISTLFEESGIDREPYITFLKSIPHSYYQLLMIELVLVTIVLGREIGPLLEIERDMRAGTTVPETPLQAPSAATGGAEQPSYSQGADDLAAENVPKRWYNAALPILALVIAILLGLMLDGINEIDKDDELSLSAESIFSAGDPFKALIWGSMIGLMVAVLLVMGQRILNISQAMDAAVTGACSMLSAILILMLAWAIGDVCRVLFVADFISQGLGDGLPAGLLPFLVYVISGLVAFSTGSSWGAMALLYPLCIPLAHGLAPDDESIMLGTIAAVLSGAVTGDQSSLISDTSVLTSLSTRCEHTLHVKTQLYYTVPVAVISCLTGYLPVGLGLYNEWVGLLLGSIGVCALVRFLGKEVQPGASRGRAYASIRDEEGGGKSA